METGYEQSPHVYGLHHHGGQAAMKEPWISTRNFAKLLSEYLPLVESVCFPIKIKCGQFNSFYLKLLETF